LLPQLTAIRNAPDAVPNLQRYCAPHAGQGETTRMREDEDRFRDWPRISGDSPL
jgi:hypothetical protein